MRKTAKHLIPFMAVAALAFTAAVPQSEVFADSAGEYSVINTYLGYADGYQYYENNYAHGGAYSYYAVAADEDGNILSEDSYAVDENGVVFDEDGSPVLYEEISVDDIDFSLPYLNEEYMELSTGDTFKLKMQNPTGDEITWSSTDTDVAKVNKNGKVTAKCGGTCKIKAKMGGKTYKCTVCVTGLNARKLTLKVGETFKLKLKHGDEEAAYSTNEAVAKINMNCKVTALKPGKTTIVFESDEGETFECKVTVKK